tara:strand:- start:606 stop:1202 length:597 start_codon:yes stop_codon:yes gene_type:complete
MSGTFPTSPAFQSLAVSSNQSTFVSRSISGRRQSRQIGGQYWRMRASFPPMTRAQFAPIYAFVIAQRGRYESFSIVPAVISTGQGSPAGTPLVNGADQTGRSLVTNGWSNSIAIFKAADYLKIAGNDKVYMVTADVSSNGSGEASIAIEPALVASPANDAAITHSSVPFTVALRSGIQEFATGTNGLFTFEIDFEEVL